MDTAVNGSDMQLVASGAGAEQIRQAATRLPERQREALELRELQRHSYEEIAVILGTSRSSVAQLIARARINLYDELRGTLLASVAAPSPECERTLPLIAAREDGQLDPASAAADAVWLDAHLTDCDRCRPAVEQMAEATASYRAWARSESPAESSVEATAAAPGESAEAPRRRPLLVVASVAALLLLGLAAAFAASGGDGPPPSPDPPADARATVGSSDGQSARVTADAKGKGKPDRRGSEKRKAEPVKSDLSASAGQPEAAAAPVTAVVPGAPQNGGAPSEPASGPSRPPGKTGVDAPRQASAPKTTAKPKPTSTSAPPTPPPATTTEVPPTEVTPPAEEAPKAPGRSGEAPGKPTGRPPHH